MLARGKFAWPVMTMKQSGTDKPQEQTSGSSLRRAVSVFDSNTTLEIILTNQRWMCSVYAVCSGTAVESSYNICNMEKMNIFLFSYKVSHKRVLSNYDIYDIITFGPHQWIYS